MARLALSLAWVAVLLAPSSLLAAHAGTDYFLLSHEGKLVRQTDWGHDAVVDGAAELVFRWQDGKLTATPFTSAKPIWSVPAPFKGRWEARWIAKVPGVLLLIDDSKATTKAIHGMDKTTGKELYRIPFGDGWLPTPYHPSCDWPTGPADEGREAVYLMRPETEGEPRDRVKTLAKYDLRNGKLLWEKPVPRQKDDNFTMVVLRPGVLLGRTASYFFDPSTGEPLTKVDPTKTRQVSYFHDLICHLSSDEPPALTGYRPGTWEQVWSVKGLTGVRHILRPHVHDRLFCATESEIVVIDTQERRERSRFPAVGLPYTEVFTMRGLVVVPDGQGYRGFDPDTGKIRWRYENKYVGDKLHQSGSLLITIEDRPEKETATPLGRKRILTVVALEVADGKERWRCPLPEYKEFYDGIHAVVMPFKSGMVVKRSWFIGER